MTDRFGQRFSGRRQDFLPMRMRIALAALFASLFVVPSLAEDVVWRHATALTGDPKYPEGFAHFDYVNPDAPKGGVVRFGSQGGFDSFNPILDTVGTPAAGASYLYDTLMTSSYDELNISAEYGLLAESMTYPADYSSVTFKLRPEAKWHDGEPVTAEDVVWSFQKTIENNANQHFYYSHVTKAEATGENEVKFTFDAPSNRELPHIMGQLQVLPKHWWEGKDAQGRQRDISRTTLEPPLGSGPYRIKSFVANRTVIYERVPDYWAKDLNVNVGTYNFDEVRFEEYRDTSVLMEAFKGDQYDWRSENSAKNWATEYKFPAVTAGKVVVEKFPDKASGDMQAYIPNLRRAKFADERVRMALNYAFDFEQLKDTIFFGQYERNNSFFAGTELASSGLPQGKELEILESVRDKIPPEVFTTPYTNPVSDTPEAKRSNLRKALELLKTAGWELKGRQLVNSSTGEPFTIEMLTNDPNSERYVLPYQQDLAKVGIALTLRSVDTPQFIERVRKRDFDMITAGWGESLSPGNEQRGYWGSKSADEPNSRNYAGIKDAGVDALVERVIYTKDRDDLVAATRALDRVLLWHHFVIPQWYLDYFRTARWDRFGHPDNLPIYTPGFPDIWWWDADKAAKVASK
jgi:microcin C transport system substrate-binding protein